MYPQEDLRAFYLATAPHLPPTKHHPEPSPFLAFYAIVCTRAFLIDLYHTVALCPFADLFNHSSLRPHSSLESDDFVCHVCGSLPPCAHDIPSSSGVVRRLEHLAETERMRVAREVDSVEMRAERPVEDGEEVMNCYGEDMGDARLLVEWGFVGDEFAGDGLTWDMDARGAMRALWEALMDRGRVTLQDLSKEAHGEGERLIRAPTEGTTRSLNLTQSGQISVSLFTYLCLREMAPDTAIDDAEESILGIRTEIEAAWICTQEHGEHDRPLSSGTLRTARAVQLLLQTRLEEMSHPELDLGALFELREVRANGCPLRNAAHMCSIQALTDEARLQRMAMTLAINERSLLVSTREKWDDIIEL